MTESKSVPFRKKYKTQGMVAAAVLMWLDFPLLYNGLMHDNIGTMTIGFITMLIIACVAFYFC